MKNKIVTILMITVLAISIVACSATPSQNVTISEELKESLKEEIKEELKEELANEFHKEDSKKDLVEESSPNADDSNDETIERNSNDPIVFETTRGKLKYLSYDLVKDYENNPAIILNFEYTNLSEESNSSFAEYILTVFQNGVSKDPAILSDDTEEISNGYKEIQQDITLNVSFAYLLDDSTSPVTLEVNESIDFDNIVKQQITLE